MFIKPNSGSHFRKTRNSRFVWIHLRVVRRGVAEFEDRVAEIELAGVAEEDVYFKRDPQVHENGSKIFFAYATFYESTPSPHGYDHVTVISNPRATFIDLRTIICPAIVIQTTTRNSKKTFACKFLEDQGRKKGYFNQ